MKVIMKVVRGSDLKFIPASHEDSKDPGVFKKILAMKEYIINGHVQMINWAKMPIGKSFASHYHEDMQEVFIIISGTAKIEVSNQIEQLNEGDAVIIPAKAVHKMTNIGLKDLDYLVVGISQELNGKTVNVS